MPRKTVQGRGFDMEPSARDYVTLVEVLELTRPFEEFADAIAAALRRLEAEGVRELVTVQFYADPGSTQVGAILTFSDRGRMIEHMNMVSEWEEFKRFFTTVKPVEVRVYGRLSREAETWIGQFGDVLGRTFGDHVAGFVR
jgi:hypothetical protein